MHPRQVTAAASRSGASPGAMPTVTLSPATVDATVATPRMPSPSKKRGTVSAGGKEEKRKKKERRQTDPNTSLEHGSRGGGR